MATPTTLLIPIQVECYAGTKADETPRRFTWEGRSIEVESVLDRWHQVESKPEWPRADYFKVRAWISMNTCSNATWNPINGIWAKGGE